MTIQLVRGDAAHLPLSDSSVDLIVTSPPYFALRSYQDNGGHYAGQIGSEATPGEFIDALIACTAEWVRCLKPSGSLWVNLGDKYAGSAGDQGGANRTAAEHGYYYRNGKSSAVNLAPTVQKIDYGWGGVKPKSLMGLPWRYALRCIDDLGLILRAEVIWSKPNGLPESVTDRVRRSHEQWFHFVQRPRYYTAVDTIREEQTTVVTATGAVRYRRPGEPINTDRKTVTTENRYTSTGMTGDIKSGANPLGKLPGSVWSIPSQPLTVPPELGVDHFAAFPMEWPRRIILGWSPSGICTGCGEGRRPVTAPTTAYAEKLAASRAYTKGSWGAAGGSQAGFAFVPGEPSGVTSERVITGECCACTPYTDHPGSGESAGLNHEGLIASGKASMGTFGGARGSAYGDRPKVGPWREYHDWTPPPTRPAVVLDPFGGTGTTVLMADVLGRHGISVDMSADYCRLARWRTTDPGQRAAAMQVEKPEPVPDGQTTIFDML